MSGAPSTSLTGPGQVGTCTPGSAPSAVPPAAPATPFWCLDGFAVPESLFPRPSGAGLPAALAPAQVRSGPGPAASPPAPPAPAPAPGSLSQRRDGFEAPAPSCLPLLGKGAAPRPPSPCHLPASAPESAPLKTFPSQWLPAASLQLPSPSTCPISLALGAPSSRQPASLEALQPS